MCCERVTGAAYFAARALRLPDRMTARGLAWWARRAAPCCLAGLADEFQDAADRVEGLLERRP